MNAKEEVKKTIGTTLSVFALAALALTAAMLLFVTPILELLKTPEQSFALARQYVVICSCGIFFICGYNAISAILRGYGDSRRPMMFIALSCALNVDVYKRQGMDTVWSSVYDLKNGLILRAEGNPARCPFDPDGRLWPEF